MGLFDFLKKEEKKEEKKPVRKLEDNREILKKEFVTIFVRDDEVPYHDPRVDMDVMLSVRADIQIFAPAPDEGEVKKAAVECYRSVFGAISGQVSVSEFNKAPHNNQIRNAMMDYMREHGFDIKYISIGFMSYNKESNEKVNGKPVL